MSDDVSRNRAVALAAAVTVAAGLGAYYIYQKNKGARKSTLAPNHSRMAVAELKNLGNKLFTQKQYAEAVEVFTLAVENGETGVDELKAMCFQNRAAARERIGASVNEIMRDCSEAIKLKPDYGKAYFRRAKLLRQAHKNMEALIDIFCAIIADPGLDKQAGEEMLAVLEPLEGEKKIQWIGRHKQADRRPVRHERVYQWLHKTVTRDVVRNKVLASKRSDGSRLGDAMQLIRDHKYDEVADALLGVDDSLEALILTARFLAYQNRHSELSSHLSTLRSRIDSLLAEGDEASRQALLSSYHVFLIECANNKDDIAKSLSAAQAVDPSNTDFLAVAAYRLTLCQETQAARELLKHVGNDHENIVLLRLLLDTLSVTESGDMAQLHRCIVNLEEFVNGLARKTPNALGLLAKIYATFQNEDGARQNIQQVLAMEPLESIHWFDLGCMAASIDDAMVSLEKCLSLEPHHAEANLMLASLRLNQMAARPIDRETHASLSVLIQRAQECFDNTVDGPAIPGVFRMEAILEAKKTAAERMSLF